MAKRARDLAATGVQFVAINSNDPEEYPEDSFDNMRAQARELGFNFPYLIDATQEVARAYGAVATPDIFGFDGTQLAYRGRIDDSGKFPEGAAAPNSRRDPALSQAKPRPRTDGVDGLLDQVETLASGPTSAPAIGVHVAWPITGTVNDEPDEEVAKPRRPAARWHAPQTSIAGTFARARAQAGQHGDDPIGIAVKHHRHRDDADREDQDREEAPDAEVREQELDVVERDICARKPSTLGMSLV